MVDQERSWSIPEPVTLILRDRAYQVKPGSDLRAALEKIGVQPETVLAIRNGIMVTEELILQPGDQVRLVHIISGG